MTFRSRSLSRLSPFCAVALICLFSASQVEARPENLRWTHLQPSNVQRFEARVSALDSSSTQTIDLGVPAADSDGIYEMAVEAGDDDVQIELRAFSSSLVASPWTPAQVRLAPSAGGGSGGGTGGGSGGGGGSETVPVDGGVPTQPIPGAANRFDFTSSAVGLSSPPWFDTRANYSRTEDDSLFGVVALGTNRVLHSDSTEDAIHSHTEGSGNVWTNFVLHGRMAVDHPAATIGVTTYSQYPASDAYYRLANNNGGSFVLEGRPGLSCSGVDTGVVAAAGTWYRFELDVVDRGTTNEIRAKIWREGDSEPGAFQVTCVDATNNRPRQGTIGVYSGGAGQKYWDDIEIVVATIVPSVPPEPPVLIHVIPVVP